jgi:hypothetical protein
MEITIDPITVFQIIAGLMIMITLLVLKITNDINDQ